MRIKQAGERGGAASIRIDDPNPDIEFVETDQAAPAGKYEIAIQADRLQINGRNASDPGFETIVVIQRCADVVKADIQSFVAASALVRSKDGVRVVNRPNFRPANGGRLITSDLLMRLHFSSFVSYPAHLAFFRLRFARPKLPTFRAAESYYATLAHEMTHWTRHENRLDRDLGRNRFADSGYAM